MDLPIINEDDSEYLVEMAEVGRRKLGKIQYKFLVFSNEGKNVPHFHLRPVNKGIKGQDVCIRLDAPEYFDHNPKYKKRLNHSEKKDFIEFLNEEDEGVTFWDLVRLNWNWTFPDRKISPGMPDYSQLPDADD